MLLPQLVEQLTKRVNSKAKWMIGRRLMIQKKLYDARRCLVGDA